MIQTLRGGHLLVVRDGTLLAQPFDADLAELGGEPVAIASSVESWRQALLDELELALETVL